MFFLKLSPIFAHTHTHTHTHTRMGVCVRVAVQYLLAYRQATPCAWETLRCKLLVRICMKKKKTYKNTVGGQ